MTVSLKTVGQMHIMGHAAASNMSFYHTLKNTMHNFLIGALAGFGAASLVTRGQGSPPAFGQNLVLYKGDGQCVHVHHWVPVCAGHVCGAAHAIEQWLTSACGGRAGGQQLQTLCISPITLSLVRHVMSRLVNDPITD